MEIQNVLIDFCVNKVEVEMEFYKSYVRYNQEIGVHPFTDETLLGAAIGWGSQCLNLRNVSGRNQEEE